MVQKALRRLGWDSSVNTSSVPDRRACVTVRLTFPPVSGLSFQTVFGDYNGRRLAERVAGQLWLVTKDHTTLDGEAWSMYKTESGARLGRQNAAYTAFCDGQTAISVAFPQAARRGDAPLRKWAKAFAVAIAGVDGQNAVESLDKLTAAQVADVGRAQQDVLF